MASTAQEPNLANTSHWPNFLPSSRAFGPRSINDLVHAKALAWAGSSQGGYSYCVARLILARSGGAGYPSGASADAAGGRNLTLAN
jgi:hypothetical protein